METYLNCTILYSEELTQKTARKTKPEDDDSDFEQPTHPKKMKQGDCPGAKLSAKRLVLHPTCSDHAV